MHQKYRGVSLGTVVMMMLTIIVLTGCGMILPRLMGTADIRIENLAMQTSVNLSDSLPSMDMSDIPISNATIAPQATAAMAVATATPAPAATVSAVVPTTSAITGTVRLTFGGSVVLDDGIRKSGYYADSDKYDFSDSLSLIADELQSDCTLVTLETITDPDGDRRSIPNAPVEAMEMLGSVGVDMAALGYNRAAERGISGIRATVENAQGSGLETIGIYTSQEDADRIRMVTIDNVSVAYLHYVSTMSSASRKKLNSDSASFALPVASMDDDAENVVEDIRKAREMGAQIVIVSMNWSGLSNFNTGAAKTKNFVQKLADAGADVIVGAGTKAFREISWIMGKRDDGTTRQTLCVWSLGSLLNEGRKDGNVTGMLLHLQLSWNGSAVSFERVTYTPTYIWRYQQDGQDRFRVVASDLPAQDGMDSSQAANAERNFQRQREELADSPVTLRTK